MAKVHIDIDLGNTQVRAIVKTGEFGVNQKDTLIILPNTFSTVKENARKYEGSVEYSDQDSTLFKLDPTRNYVNKPQDYFLTSGKLQQAEFGLSTLPKANMQFKVNVLQSYASIFAVITRALTWLVDNKLVKSKTVATASKEVSFDLAILLPPTQRDVTSELFAEKLLGLHKISSIYPLGELAITIDNVTFEQEGLAAFFTLQATKDLKPRKGLADRLKDATVLGIDMGGSTFDLVVVSKRTTLESSRHTITQGGSQVIAKIRTYLQKITPRTLSDEVVMRTMLTGKYDDGTTEHNLIDVVNRCKAEVAEALVKNIINYLEGATFDIYDVSLIMATGGNMLKPDVAGLDSLGELVIQGLLEYLPRAEVLDLNDYDFSDYTEVYGNRVPMERLLNIYGLSIMTNMMAISRPKKA